MNRVTTEVSAMLAGIVTDLLADGVDPDGERVYLLHFTAPYHHAQHYLGWTRRLLVHLTGQGSPLVAAVVEAGIGVALARTWAGGRATEQALKRRKRHRTLCPLCAAVDHERPDRPAGSSAASIAAAVDAGAAPCPPAHRAGRRLRIATMEERP